MSSDRPYAMHIEKTRAVLLSHPSPAEPRLSFVGGYIASWDAALVEVVAEDGTVGLGEVAQGIFAAGAVPGILEVLAPSLRGMDIEDPAKVADGLRAQTLFWARGAICRGVIGAIETALWDIRGKQLGKPVYELFGGPAHESLELYASGGLGTTIGEVVAYVKAQEELGLATVKFRGLGNPDETIELLHVVTSELSADTGFVLDLVQGCSASPWPLEEVIRVGKVAAKLGARWFEEPCTADDVNGYVQVRRQVDVPVSGVESFASYRDFEALISRGGVDIVQPDVAMVGGPTEARRVADLAAEHGLGCVPHVWGSGVTLMANMHLAAATPNMPLVEYCTVPNPIREAVLAQPLAVVDSHVHPPDTPGLGVELTPEIEARFPYRPGGGHVIYRA